MRILPLVPVPVLIALLAGCQPSAEQPAPPRTAEQFQADVEALRAQWQELANADDFAGVADLYTEDAYYVDQYGNITEGRTAIAAYFEQSFPRTSGYDIQVAGTVMDSEMVASYGTWAATLTGPAGELPTSGFWQTVGVYQADGTLKLRLHHAMVPAAPPTS